MVMIILAVVTCIGSINAQETTVRDIIRKRIEEGKKEKKITADGIKLYSRKVLPLFYEKNDYYPAWFKKDNFNDFFDNINDSYNEGLNPRDYHLERIEEIIEEIKETNDIEKMADLDMLMTDGILLYATHLIIGKVDQSKITAGWDVPSNSLPANGEQLLLDALKAEDLSGAINRLKPDGFFYRGVRSKLKEYRKIAAAGGWPRIPPGKALKLGVVDERVKILRDYLKITGDYPENKLLSDDSVFDGEMEKAVKKVQIRHNFNPDGIVGEGTLHAINVPVEKRIEQMRVTLERARWVFHKMPDDFLVVNIAGFYIKRMTKGKITFYSRVIVGKRFHETPIFHGKLQYIDLNPTWTLPYSIAAKESLPRMKKDPNYLKNRNMVIMNRDGKILDPATIDFSKLTERNFPYIIRQEPGPRNSLGQVKFMFPNRYSVYLHDTPARYLFSHEDRAYSHGCIRLEKKWELFLNLMDDPEVWNMEKINKILATKKTKRIVLKKPVDIFLLYWTAGVNEENHLEFFEDVYDRDAAVLKELNKPIVFEKVD
jgi:murein L,D-transpeptidase YcbB/YkuD